MLSPKSLNNPIYPLLFTVLTPNTPLIHTSFTYSKWNMGEICGLKFHLIYVHASQNFLLKSLHAQKVSFLLHRKVDLCSKVADSVIKMTPFAHGGISIKFFVMYVHILNETLSHKFHPYSILST